MECDLGRRVSLFSQLACAAQPHLTAGQFKGEIWVNHLPAEALLDSGSIVKMVHARVIRRLGPVSKTLRVICIHGETREYPLVPVTVLYGGTSVTKEVGVVNSLDHEFIVGRDCSLFSELLNQVPSGLARQSKGLETMGPKGPQSGESDPEPPTTDPVGVNIPSVDNNGDSVSVSGLKSELTLEGRYLHYRPWWARLRTSSPTADSPGGR